VGGSKCGGVVRTSIRLWKGKYGHENQLRYIHQDIKDAVETLFETGKFPPFFLERYMDERLKEKYRAWLTGKGKEMKIGLEHVITGVEWWVERLQRPREEQLLEFRLVLLDAVLVAIKMGGVSSFAIGTDYEPKNELAHAAEVAGISEHLFPKKTMVFINECGVRVREGYGKPLRRIGGEERELIPAILRTVIRKGGLEQGVSFEEINYGLFFGMVNESRLAETLEAMVTSDHLLQDERGNYRITDAGRRFLVLGLSEGDEARDDE